MSYTESLTESYVILGKIDPQSLNGNALTDAVDISKHARVLFIVQTGVLATNNTTDFKVTGCATSGGSYVDVTGATITQVIPTAGNSKIMTVEVRAEAIAALGLGHKFLKGSLTTATAAGLVSCVVLGGVTYNKPANGGDLAAVTQAVVV